MGIGPVFLEFLQRIAVGAGGVFALFLVIQMGMPRRSKIAVSRRTTK
jgi:hypothetical protein